MQIHRADDLFRKEFTESVRQPAVLEIAIFDAHLCFQSSTSMGAGRTLHGGAVRAGVVGDRR
jgi:hypothetical protein